MAKIVGGIGASHSPTIGFAKDTTRRTIRPGKPIFEGFAEVRDWVQRKEIDVLFMIYNDHITSFFFDHYSAFALGIDDTYIRLTRAAGRATCRRRRPCGAGAACRHGADRRRVRHELLPGQAARPRLPVAVVHDGRRERSVAGQDRAVAGRRAAIADPDAEAMYKLGKSLRKAIQSYPEDLRVAIVATGGLSTRSMASGPASSTRNGTTSSSNCLKAPEKLVDMRLAEYAVNGGMEGAEVIMWLIMRGALSDKVARPFKHDLRAVGDQYRDAGLRGSGRRSRSEGDRGLSRAYGLSSGRCRKRWRGPIPSPMPAASKISASTTSCTADHSRAPRAVPERFRRAGRRYGLTDEEIDLIKRAQVDRDDPPRRQLFVLEKMAAVVGVSNPEVYAAMRGETLDEFMKTRKVPIQYSVAGGQKALEMDETR
jgi:gallate dioxygenase